MTDVSPPGPAAYLAEPAAPWLSRPPVVVDCSMLASVLFAEPAAPQALRLLGGRALHAPALLPYEIANVAVNKLRQGARADDVAVVMGEFAEQAIALHAVDAGGAVALAHRYRLSAYDAAYLWLAAELKAPLATFDRRLGEAAQEHLRSLE